VLALTSSVVTLAGACSTASKSMPTQPEDAGVVADARSEAAAKDGTRGTADSGQLGPDDAGADAHPVNRENQADSASSDATTESDATAGDGSAHPPRVTYDVAARVHIGASSLTVAEVGAALDQTNEIWLQQAGVQFEFEITMSETDRADGLDIRFLEDGIDDQCVVNGLTLGPHQIYVIDHPVLYPAPNPARNATGRTLAHEIGHAFGLAHENPPGDPPYNDCMDPCVCMLEGLVCDDFLMRSHHQGFFLSDVEVGIARTNAHAAIHHAPRLCGVSVVDASAPDSGDGAQ
jgi:hypothetical protein